MRYLSCDKVTTCLGFTCSVRAASRPSGEGRTSDDPRRLPSYRDILTCFRREDPVYEAFSGKIGLCPLAHRFAFVEVSPTVSVPAGNSAFRYGDLTRTRSWIETHDQRCVRSISATQHSANEYPYSAAPGSSSGLAPCVHLKGCALQDRGNRAFSRRPNRFGGSPGA